MKHFIKQVIFVLVVIFILGGSTSAIAVEDLVETASRCDTDLVRSSLNGWQSVDFIEWSLGFIAVMDNCCVGTARALFEGIGNEMPPGWGKYKMNDDEYGEMMSGMKEHCGNGMINLLEEYKRKWGGIPLYTDIAM